MALTRSCSSSFDSAMRSRGAAYYYGRCVEITNRRRFGVTALVSGGSPEPYEVDLDWTRVVDGAVDAYCSCPRYAEGNLCKHVWATILAADAQGLSPHIIKGPNLVVFHEQETEEEPGSWGRKAV